MGCTERLYLNDSKLLQFQATVTDIREFARRDGVQVWHVALDRSAFYPESGGQPWDAGSLRAVARSGAALEVPVEEVVEDEAGEVWHQVRKPLLAGTAVEGLVDGERRADHRQQHSGQHLLSAVLADEYGARTVGFHLGDEDATIDLATEDREALAAMLPEVELRVNRLVAQNLPVAVREVSGEEAQALLASGAVRKLPPRSGPIRLVEMPGVDLNACGGTHVAALGEIGGVLLRGTEKVKAGLRLHFVCGLRAVRAARSSFEALGEAAGALSVGAGDVSAAVRRVQAEARALSKERVRLREELAEQHAVRLAVEERIVDGLRLVARVFPDRDAEYLKLLAAKLLAAVPQTSAVLVSTADEPATVVVACNRGKDPGCDGLLRQVLGAHGLKGGGTRDMAQGRVPAALVPEVVASLSGLLKSA